MKIILGSQSDGRRKILESMGCQFEVMNPSIDEKAIRFDDPIKLTLAIANAKADILLPKIQKPAILITADLVVAWNGKILEKPKDKDEAREFLRGYSIKPPETVVAVVVVDVATGKRREGVDVVKLWFKTIPDDELEKLISSEYVCACAGGFFIEDPTLKKYIDKIDGDVDSVIGLPKKLIGRFLEEIKTEAR